MRRHRAYRRVRHHHLKGVVDKAALFGTVQLVEIEVHSHCNRTCWFCPNSTIDRRSTTQLMSEETYVKLLWDMKSAGFKGRISYSRYNEPFSDPIFLHRVSQARAIFPGIRLNTNTNGDFLNNDVLREATEAGLTQVSIQLYLKEDEPFQMENIERLKDKLAKRISHVKIGGRSRKSGRVFYQCEYNGLAIKLYARNFRKNGTNRGDIDVRGEVKRTGPCFEAFTYVYIDWNGEVVPCCNIRSDYPGHSHCTLGNINEQSIVDIYAGPKAVAWRRSVADFGEKHSPCSGCSFAPVPDNQVNRAASKKLLEEQ